MDHAGRILVLGARGMLGAALVRVLRAEGHVVAGLTRVDFDPLLQPAARLPLENCIAVVNAIGIINRHVGKLDDSLFWRINGLFPRQLADHCGRVGVPLIHVSTDCVFAGRSGPHLEDAVTDAEDLYGRSKAAGEPANALVLRTSIIGPELDHHYSLMSWVCKQPGPLPGYTDHLWNGVTTFELSRLIGLLIRRDRHREHRLHHIHGEDLSKFRLLQLIDQVFALGKAVIPTESSQARDTRLGTLHGDWLAALAVRPMRQQLTDLLAVCGQGLRLEEAAA